jgi:hypothetical protein
MTAHAPRRRYGATVGPGRDGDGSVQLGSALSVHLIPAMGPARTAWLRLTIGALIFLAPGAELWTDPANNPSHAAR